MAGRSVSSTLILPVLLLPYISTRTPSSPKRSCSHSPRVWPTANTWGIKCRSSRPATWICTAGMPGSAGVRVGLPSPPAASDSAPPRISPMSSPRYAPQMGRSARKVIGSMSRTIAWALDCSSLPW